MKSRRPITETSGNHGCYAGRRRRSVGRATRTFMMRRRPCRRLGHEWQSAARAERALRVRRVRCSISGLPELEGRDCLVNLRARANLTPVVVTTAQGSRAAHPAARPGRRRLPDQALRPGRAGRAREGGDPAQPPRRAAADEWRQPRPAEAAAGSNRCCGTARTGTTAREYRVLDTLVWRRGSIGDAPAARSRRLRLEREHRQQRHRGAHPQPAAQPPGRLIVTLSRHRLPARHALSGTALHADFTSARRLNPLRRPLPS